MAIANAKNNSKTAIPNKSSMDKISQSFLWASDWNDKSPLATKIKLNIISVITMPAINEKQRVHLEGKLTFEEDTTDPETQIAPIIMGR